MPVAIQTKTGVVNNLTPVRTQLTATLDAAPTAGHLLRLVVAADKTVGAWGAAPAGWEYEGGVTYVGADVSQAVLIKRAAATTDTSVTVTWTTQVLGAVWILTEYQIFNAVPVQTEVDPDPPNSTNNTGRTTDAGAATAAGFAFSDWAIDTWTNVTASEPTWTGGFVRVAENRMPVVTPGDPGDGGGVMASTASKDLAVGTATLTSISWTRSDQTTQRVSRYTGTASAAGGSPTVAGTSGAAAATTGAVAVTVPATPTPGAWGASTSAFVRVFDENGTSLGDLLEVQDLTEQREHNREGALSFNYPSDGVNAHLLDRDEAYLAVVDGGVVSDAWYSLEEDADDEAQLEGRPVAVTGRGLLAEFEYARVYPADHVAGETGYELDGQISQIKYSAKTPGFIIHDLFTRAKGRGALAGLSIDFTATTTSAGGAWGPGHSVTYEAGKDLYSILTSLADGGLVDLRVENRTLRAYMPDTVLNTDRPNAIIKSGRDSREARRKRSRRGIFTHILGAGDDTLMYEGASPTAAARFGRREGFDGRGGITEAGALASLVEASLKTTANTKEGFTLSYSLDGVPDQDGQLTYPPRPGVDFHLGERIRYDKRRTDSTTLEPLRVRAITRTWGSDGTRQCILTLNDPFVESRILTQRKVDGIVSGSVSTGTPPVKTPRPDTTIPRTPTGLVLTTETYLVGPFRDSYYRKGVNFSRALITATWSATTDNTDGSPITDLAGYRVSWRYAGGTWSGETLTTTATWTRDGFEPGRAFELRVRAVDTLGKWSNTYLSGSGTTAVDNTPPPTPSAPTWSTRLGVLRVNWDGFAPGGVDMPVDFQEVEVHLSTTVNFTPVAGVTTIGTLSGAGSVVSTNLAYGTSYYVRLVATDVQGNRSAPTAAITVSVQALVDTDVIGEVISGAKIQDGTIVASEKVVALSVTTAQLAALAVTAGKIAANAVEADKIAAGAITADKIGVGQVPADRLELGAGTNLVNDPSFEDVAYWAAAIADTDRKLLSLGSVWDVDNHGASSHGGIQVLRHPYSSTGTATATFVGAADGTTGRACIPGQRVYAAGWAKTTGAYVPNTGTPTVASVVVSFYDAANTLITSQSTPFGTAGSLLPAWTFAQVTAKAPATAVRYTAGVRVAGHFAGEPATNLLPNPSAESNTTGWAGSGGTLTRVLTTASGPAWGYGSYAFRLAATGSQLTFAAGPDITATPGQVYTASATVRGSAAGRYGQVALQYRNDALSQVGITTGTLTVAPAPTGDGTRLSVTGTVPTGATKVRVIVYNKNSDGSNPAAGATLDFDGAMLSLTSSLRAYSEGEPAVYRFDDVTVMEAIGTPNGSGQSVEISPSGLRLYDADGAEVIGLTSTPPNYLNIGRVSTTGELETVASISEDGNIVGQVVDADDLRWQATQVVTSTDYARNENFAQARAYGQPSLLAGVPWGLIGYGAQGGVNGPATDNQTGVGWFEIDVDLVRGRMYRLTIGQMRFVRTAGSTNLQAYAAIVHTSDGSAPTVDSPALIQVGGNVFTTGTSQELWTFAASTVYRPPGSLGTVTRTRLLLKYGLRHGFGSNTITAVGADASGLKGLIYVEDIGPDRTNLAQTNNGGGGVTGSPTPPPATSPPRQYTKRYMCTWSGTYRSDALDNPGSSEMKQGTLSPYVNYGLFGFDDAQIRADLAGATVDACQVYLYANHWYNNSGGTTIIGTTGHGGGRPSTLPAGTRMRVESAGWPKPGARVVNLTATIGNEFKSGATRSLSLGDGRSGLLYYGRFNGDGMANEPYLEITYTK